MASAQPAATDEPFANELSHVVTEARLLHDDPKRTVVRITVTSPSDASLTVHLISAGGVQLKPPAGFAESPKGFSYFAGTKINQRITRRISLRAGKTIEFDVAVTVSQTPGSITVGAEDAADVGGEGSILHLVRTADAVISSATSALDLQAELLRYNKGQKSQPRVQLTPEAEDEEVQALFRGGATTRVIAVEEKADTGPVTYEAQVVLTARGLKPRRDVDYGDVLLPARFIDIEFFDKDGETLTSLGTATTDANGFASIPAAGIEEDGTGQDVLLRAYAKGQYVQVVRDTSNTPVHTIDSSVQTDLANGGRIVLTTDRRHSNNRAFEVHESIDREARFLSELAPANQPSKVTVRYPRKVGSISSYSGGTVWLLDQDAHDWDNIQHEYGHHLGAALKIGRNPGGAHSGAANLCKAITAAGQKYGKERGVNLAFSESWPTAMAVINQHHQNDAALGIVYVGDTRFTNISATGRISLNYDLENTGPQRLGEAVEYSLMETIWDLYDSSNENADGVTIGVADIWRALLQGGRRPFHGFWNALHASRPYEERNALGNIIAWRRLSGTPTAPASESHYRGGPLTLQWRGADGCLGNTGQRYQVVFTNDTTGEVRWQSPFAAATSRVLTDEERQTVFAGPRGERLRWTIVARDTDMPQTGAYSGGSAVIVDDVP